MGKWRGMAFEFRNTATAVKKHRIDRQLQLAMKILLTTKTALRTNLHERETEVFK
jgi:hypothetical protein